MKPFVEQHLGALDRLAKALADKDYVIAERLIRSMVKVDDEQEEVPANLVAEFNLDELWDLAADRVVPTILSREDGKCLLYAGKTHSISGEPGVGKTLTTLRFLQQVLDNDPETHVVFLDFESDAKSLVRRLRSLGMKREQVARFHYVRVERLGLDYLSVLAKELVALVQSVPTSVLVLDGFAQALAMAGLDENSNSDVSLFAYMVMNVVAAAGPATVIIDHIPKPGEGGKGGQGQFHTRYARGASAKLAVITGAAYLLTMEKAFSRSVAGSAKLILSKDREGEAPGAEGDVVCKVVVSPDPGGATTSITFTTPVVAEKGTFVPTIFMERLSSDLQKASSSATEVDDFLRSIGAYKHKKDILAPLVKYGFVHAEKNGKSMTYSSLKPFVHDENGELMTKCVLGNTDKFEEPAEEPF